jgi:hypothetical protein
VIIPRPLDNAERARTIAPRAVKAAQHMNETRFIHMATLADCFQQIASSNMLLPESAGHGIANQIDCYSQLFCV